MKAASEKQRAECNRLLNSNSTAGPELDCVVPLRNVAETFFQAQQQRHTADYDNSKQWTRTEVLAQIELVQGAFASWKAIRDEPAAQAYLISLLGNPRG